MTKNVLIISGVKQVFQSRSTNKCKFLNIVEYNKFDRRSWCVGREKVSNEIQSFHKDTKVANVNLISSQAHHDY